MTKMKPIRATEVQFGAFAGAISAEFPFAVVTKLIINLELQGVPKRRKEVFLSVKSKQRKSGPRICPSQIPNDIV